MIRPQRSLALVAVLAACCTLGIMAGGGLSLFPRGDEVPVLQHTEFIDLGTHEQRGIAVGRFQVRNAGRGLLLLDRFRSSCSCAGVEREVDGKFLQVQSVRLRGGEQLELLLRVSVTARAGEQQHIACSFESNDPDRPQGRRRSRCFEGPGGRGDPSDRGQFWRCAAWLNGEVHS